MNLQLYGRSSGELSALDRMSNSLIMGRHMHGAVGIAAFRSEPIVRHAAAAVSTTASHAAAHAAGAGSGGFTIFGFFITDAMIFWAIMINIVFMSFLMFMFALHMLNKIPQFPPCAKGYENRYEYVGATDADGGNGKEVGGYTILGVGVDDDDDGDGTTEEQEKEKLIPTKPDDAA